MWPSADLYAGAFLLFFVLASCNTASHAVRSEDAVVIKDVPFFAQEDFQCGPSSLAGVLNYWGVRVSPEDIAKEVYSRSARGTLDLDMVLYPGTKGMEAMQYSGSLEDLRKHIRLGFPVIVLVDNGFYLYQVNHFMTVTGFTSNGFIVNSGKEKEKFLAEEEFTGPWEKTKFWTLLIKPGDRK